MFFLTLFAFVICDWNIFTDPCFNSCDAELVLVIHSNPGGLGKREPCGKSPTMHSWQLIRRTGRLPLFFLFWISGDADFYPNGLNPLPPGCLTTTCAHHRSAKFFAESIYLGGENNFLSVKCKSLESLDSHCSKERYPMRYDAPNTLKGIFFLKTNKESPFGLNADKLFKATCAKWKFQRESDPSIKLILYFCLNLSSLVWYYTELHQMFYAQFIS